MNYNEIFTFENLYKAHIKARLSKRYKTEVINFELSTGSNIAKLFYELKNKNYKISEYNTFYIYEPKERRVDALKYRDRIVQHCLCDNFLTPLLEKRLIYDNAATRINKGTDFARNRLRHFYYDYFNKHKSNVVYVLKCDIHHFFENIDHNVLKSLLTKDVRDKDILNLLFIIIDSYQSDTNKGLPIGNQTSQAFAIRYLDEMDRLIKEKYRIKYYIRYMDDFILVHNDKTYLKMVLDKINSLLKNKYKIELNKKTRIYYLKDSVEFLGFKFKLLDNGKIIMKLDSKKSQRLKRNLNKRIGEYKTRQISLSSLKSSICSTLTHVKKGNNYSFYKYIQKLNDNIK